MVKSRRKAERKLKTLAGRLVREFQRKASRGWNLIYREELELFERVLAQGRQDKNKIYSLHDPTVQCIGKGKAHKKWGTEERSDDKPSDDKPSEARRFGRKASVAMTRDHGIIVGAVSFEENIWDGDTLDSTIIQSRMVAEKSFKSALVARGYQGRSEVSGVQILAPHRVKKSGSYYEKAKDRKRFARRSAIEPVIGHLKNDYRMARCFLKGALGASQNPMLAAAAWNLKKWINGSSFLPEFVSWCCSVLPFWLGMGNSASTQRNPSAA